MLQMMVLAIGAIYAYLYTQERNETLKMIWIFIAAPMIVGSLIITDATAIFGIALAVGLSMVMPLFYIMGIWEYLGKIIGWMNV